MRDKMLFILPVVSLYYGLGNFRIQDVWLGYYGMQGQLILGYSRILSCNKSYLDSRISLLLVHPPACLSWPDVIHHSRHITLPGL